MVKYRQLAQNAVDRFRRRQADERSHIRDTHLQLSELLSKRAAELRNDKAWCHRDVSRDAILAVLVEQTRDNASSHSASGWWNRRQAKQLDRKVRQLRDYLTRFSVIWANATGEDEMFFPLGYVQECIWRAKDTYARGIRTAGVSDDEHMPAMVCWAAISLAGELTRRATTLATWQSGALDNHGLRADLDGELAELTRQLREAADLYHKLGAAPIENQTPEDRHLKELHRRGIDSVNAATSSATKRLAALQTYVDRLSEIDRINKSIQRADEIQLLDGRIDGLISASGADELAQEALTRSAAGVSDMRQALSDAWAQLRGDYLAIGATAGYEPR